MNLLLTEEQSMIQDMARRFAQSELAPIASKLDHGGDREDFLDNLSKLLVVKNKNLNIYKSFVPVSMRQLLFVFQKRTLALTRPI